MRVLRWTIRRFITVRCTIFSYETVKRKSKPKLLLLFRWEIEGVVWKMFGKTINLPKEFLNTLFVSTIWNVMQRKLVQYLRSSRLLQHLYNTIQSFNLCLSLVLWHSIYCINVSQYLHMFYWILSVQTKSVTYLNSYSIDANGYLDLFRFNIRTGFRLLHLLWKLQSSNCIFDGLNAFCLINRSAAQKLKIKSIHIFFVL